MGATLDRLTCYSQSDRPARRKVARAKAHASAIITSSASDLAKVTLADVSSNGCSIRTDAEWLRPGKFIGIALDDQAPVQAIVRWCRDGAAGLEFLRPIPADNTAWQALFS